MLFDSIPLLKNLSLIRGSDFKRSIIASVARLFEEKTGAVVVYPSDSLPFERADLLGPAEIAKRLYDAKIIQSIAPMEQLPDEPPLRLWGATINARDGERTGGASFDSDVQAFYAASAESLERYIWYEETDYFDSPVRATVDEIRKRGAAIEPAAFAGYTDVQRASHPARTLRPDARYLWIRAVSLISNTPVWIPAQTISGERNFQTVDGVKEPIIRSTVTTGLATWTDKEAARYRGILEIIERDAYMIWWLNQLAAPRVDLHAPELSTLTPILQLLKRYRLQLSALSLPTDAPAHVICATIEDESGIAPKYAFGLKAGATLADTIKGAALEALRARRGERYLERRDGAWNPTTPVTDVGHIDRVMYWGAPEHASKLSSLLRGPLTHPTPTPWEGHASHTHLPELLRWCAEKKYDCVSVSLSSSKKNLTALHVEMVCIPQMQPVYLHESSRQWGSARLRDVPNALGFPVRNEPYGETPHPFA